MKMNFANVSMMNRIALVVAGILGTAACEGLTGPIPGDRLINLDEEFTLSMGQGGWTPDSAIGVRFSSVPQDSRCRADVECVWEGFARVGFTVTISGVDYTPTLSTNPSICCTADTVDGFALEIRGLDPLPRSGQTDIPYEARLLVRRTS